MTVRNLAALAVLAAAASAPAVRAQPAGAPASTPPDAPAPAGTASASGPPPPAAPPPPAYPYPPAYAYPAPYPYPSGASPQGYPGYPYPAYPGGYAAYPGYRPPPATTVVAPAPLPAGHWRLGATLLLIPQGLLSYDLRDRGESQQYYSRGIKTTGGVSALVEYDGIRYLHLGFGFQILPSVEWERPPAGSTTGALSGGTARAFDFLPQLGARYAATPRLRLLAYVAPGYSIFSTSGMADLSAGSGTAHGLVVQAACGVLYAIGEHAFFSLRGSYQWGYQNHEIHSSTTGESAEIRFRFNFAALQGSVGYWF